MRLIDADDFGNRMYHEAFEKDSDLQKWDSGCWIRYKLFENVLRGQPTIQPVATDTNVGDIISRQTAINTLCSKCTVDKPETCSTIQKGDNWCEEVYILQRVPSAQPEIVRCKDCKHYHTDVFGGEIGINGMYENLIVGHSACDRWSEYMNSVDPDGFCFLAKRRTDER